MLNPVIIGDATLYHGDALEILPQLGECADMVFTDPPYFLTSGGPGKPGCMTDWQLAEGYENDGQIVDCLKADGSPLVWGDFMPLLCGAARGNAHVYTMANNRHVKDMLVEAEKAKLRFHNLLIWDKGTCTPNRFGMKNAEFIGFFFVGKAKHWNDCGAKQLIFVPQEDFEGHPTVKPVGLCENYIRQSTVEGETILDPFSGTSSTGIAALKSGRKFIGIEKKQKWFDLSVKRITDFYDKPQQMPLAL